MQPLSCTKGDLVFRPALPVAAFRERELRACTDDGAHALHVGEVRRLHGIRDGRGAVREHDGIIIERDRVVTRRADAVGRGRSGEHTKLGQAASGLVDKAKGFYEKFKQKFGVS